MRMRRATAAKVLNFVIDHHGRMIGKNLVAINRRRVGHPIERRRREVIIQSPTDVVLPRPAAIRPPRIMNGFGADQLAKGVVKPDAQEGVQPGALFWQKAAVLLVAAPIFQIDLLMRDVEVSAKYQFAFAFTQPPAM